MLVLRQLFIKALGAKIVGIIDKEGGLINENGFTFEEVCELFLNKKGNNLNATHIKPFDVVKKNMGYES